MQPQQNPPKNKQHQQQQQQQQYQSTNYFKSFKQTLTQKYLSFTRQQLLQKLIQTQIHNKQLTTHLSTLQPYKQKHLRDPNLKKIQKLFKQFQSNKFALKICYLGHLYDGMAMQNQTQNTIEGYLFKCLYTLNLIEKKQPGEDYTRAGRTDKGVSAMGNVVALKLRTKERKKIGNINSQIQNNNHHVNNHVNTQQIDINKIKQKPLNYCQMLNSILPQDIRILCCQPVSSDFNARYWCIKRSYKYFFVKNNLSIQTMKNAIKMFQGKHNFINFCKMNLCNTVNFEREIIKAEVIKVDDMEQLQKSQNNNIIKLDDRNDVYYFHFVGNSFLWHQIRFMSSVLFMIGQGTQPITIISDLLNIQKYPRKPNYTMAPQYPLILQDCQYQNLQFNPDPQTIYKFYNTFHTMISKLTIQKTLIINCMHLAKRDLFNNIKLSEEMFTVGVLQNYKRTHKVNKKSMELHKASGRGVEDAIKSLKGKKKQLYEKKAMKQKQYEERIGKDKLQLQLQLQGKMNQ